MSCTSVKYGWGTYRKGGTLEERTGCGEVRMSYVSVKYRVLGAIATTIFQLVSIYYQGTPVVGCYITHLMIMIMSNDL